MSGLKVTLSHGWEIGDETHMDVELRRLTAGDIIEAGEAAEKVVATPDGYTLVQSPTRAGIEMLCRQIVRIGTLEGIEVTVTMIKALDPEDLEALQIAGDGIANADMALRKAPGKDETAARGRGDPAPA